MALSSFFRSVELAEIPEADPGGRDAFYTAEECAELLEMLRDRPVIEGPTTERSRRTAQARARRLRESLESFLPDDLAHWTFTTRTWRVEGDGEQGFRWVVIRHQEGPQDDR